MIDLKVLSTAATLALVLPVVTSDASFAQGWHGNRGAAFSGGAVRGSGGAFSGGGFRGSAAVAASPRVSGAMAATPRFAGTTSVATGASVATGPRYVGTNWNSGYRGWNGGYYRHRYGYGGFIPGAVAGAVIGGALASSYYDPYYYGYGPGYYDDSYAYYDGGTVAVAAGPAGDPSYCAQRFRSYDPASGTYLGYDGQRHPCP